jgi:hypothetical protein
LTSLPPVFTSRCCKLVSDQFSIFLGSTSPRQRFPQVVGDQAQAASWKTAWRVVAKVECHFGELFPRVGFIVTNLETDSRAVVRF